MKQMNKIFSFVIPLFLLGGISSCNQQNEALIPYFSYSDTSSNESVKTLLALSSNEVSSLIEKKASFPLFVRGSTCDSCSTFNLYLKSFLNAEDLLLPTMTSAEYSLVSSSLTIDSDSVVFYKEGSILASKTMSDEYYNSKALKSLFFRYGFSTGITIFNSGYIQSEDDYSFLTINDSLTDSNNLTPFDLDDFKGKTLNIFDFDNLSWPDFQEYLIQNKTAFQNVLFFSNEELKKAGLWTQLNVDKTPDILGFHIILTYSLEGLPTLSQSNKF